MPSLSSTAVDPRFKDEIAVAISQVQEPDKKISVKNVVGELEAVIINSYNNKPSNEFKSVWINRIVQTLRLLDISYINTKPDWERIAFGILDRKLNTQDPAVSSPISTLPTSASTSTSSTSTTSSGSNSTQQKLSSTDKERVIAVYRNLDPSKMWRLSSGTVIEKKMEEFALKCNYEHPCHSIILDTSDHCWEDVFSPEDLMEIKHSNCKQLTPLPKELDDYIKTFKTISNMDDLYERVLTLPLSNPDKEWIQSTIYNCYKLFLYKYLPLTDQSESDIMRRIWQAIDTAFDNSIIDCRSGEKSSNASSEVGMLFKKGTLEFGCLEAGRLNVEHGTKELCDGSFKMPKVMKDIFVQLSNSSPALVREISVAGFLIMETKFTLMTLDSPGGYVCRVNRLTPLLFPDVVETFSRQLLPIIQVIYQGRLMMENTYMSLIHDKTPISIGFNNDKQSPIPPCFQSMAPLNKKRRRTSSAELEEQ